MHLVRKNFIFLVACFLVGVSFASPTTSKYDREVDGFDGTNGFFSPDVANSVKHFTAAIEKSFKGFVYDAEHLFKNLNTVFRNVLENGFVNVATWAVDIVARMEFLVMADGSHFMFPLGGTVEEQEHKAVAIAVSKLLRNLKTMELTDKLITNATRKVLGDVDLETRIKDMKSSTPENVYKTFVHKYFEYLDHLFEADDVLASQYKEEKSKATKYVKREPNMRGPVFKVWENSPKLLGTTEFDTFLKDKQIVREAHVNKIFLKQAVKHLAMIFNTTHHDRYLMARAVILKAETSGYESKVNEVYHKALVRAAGIAYLDTHDDVISDVLFDSIGKALEADHTLHKEIRDLMKEVGSKTVYDIDTLHVDFSPL